MGQVKGQPPPEKSRAIMLSQSEFQQAKLAKALVL
jgi:hypothetical protein